MEYLRLKCPVSRKAQSEHEPVEVTLAQFAAMGGMTEVEYSKRMFELLHQGELLRLLKFEANCDLVDWITEGPLCTGEDFVVVFCLSKNKKKDSALYCVCTVDFEAEDPKILMKRAIHGVMDDIPVEIEMEGLDGFELNLCDLEATI